MKKIIYPFVFLIGIFIAPQLFGQDFYRISADFTIKAKRSDGSMELTKGRVFYDKFEKDIIYEVSFPEKEKWVAKDNRLLKITQDTAYELEMPSMSRFSIFHLSLNSNLTHYGLNTIGYKIGKVERKKDLVVSYWEVPVQMREFVKTIAVAKKGDQLHSVVMVNSNDRIVSKQFFQDYYEEDGFDFPRKVIQITIEEKDGAESYEVIEFKDIKLNDEENEEKYKYEE